MEKFVIFTVDVEGHVGKDPVQSLIYGRTVDGRLCGIDMLMDTLDEFHIKGLFFVDIAEAWDYGEEKIIEVLRHINERGHDVGVHIHPDHMADRHRMFLADYSYNEQFAIIQKCTELYRTALDKSPLAFRAGKYSANWDTLDILSKLGYLFDFSEYYGQKWCKINPPCTYLQMVKLDNGIVEVPVTSFKSFCSRFYSRFDKIDATQLSGEFNRVVDILANRQDCTTIVLFAHSFSFLKWRRKPNAPVFSPVNYQRLRKQLESVRKNKALRMIELIDLQNAEYERPLPNKPDFEFVSLTGIQTVLPFVHRAVTVLKSRYDIRYRRF